MGISKMEAAQRQLDAAIRLFFANEDWIAVHTLAAASGGILRELAKHRGGLAWERLNASIRPEKRKYVWGKINLVANFCKHAKREGDKLPELDLVFNDHFIRINCTLFCDLKGRMTHSMTVFSAWYGGAYPDTIQDTLPISDAYKRLSISAHQGLSRAEQLAFWRSHFLSDNEAGTE